MEEKLTSPLFDMFSFIKIPCEVLPCNCGEENCSHTQSQHRVISTPPIKWYEAILYNKMDGYKEMYLGYKEAGMEMKEEYTLTLFDNFIEGKVEKLQKLIDDATE